MMGMQQGNGWHDFPFRLLIVKNNTSDPLFYQLLDGNVLERLSKNTIAALILRYWQTCPATAPYRLMPADAKVALDFFSSFATSFDELIEPVLFKSDIGYCFRRLSFDPKHGQTPTFDELMSRTSNARALKAWIGSLFDAGSERQQYVWIFGDGMNGKSSLAKFLQNIFGPGATSAQPPGRDVRFWTAQFLGKRLAIMPDCSDFTFINSGLFKSHTGGDHIPVEEKGQGTYCIEPTWKFLILSNQKPSIEDEASAVRRAIYCKMSPITTKRLADTTYQALLNSEAPAFIAQCIDCYKELAPGKGAVETDAAITKELTDATEERWAFIANRHLCIYEEGTLDQTAYNEMPFVTRHYMRGIQKSENLSASQYQQFLNYLERRHGIRVHDVKVGGQGRHVYIKCASRGGEHYADSVANGQSDGPATGAATVHKIRT